MWAEFIYCRLLRPWPLRPLANSVIRALLPPRIRLGPATVVLNPRDPVVSGALTLRVYERDEIQFFRNHCAAGMTVVDIGANVGCYTALAMHAVGPSGRVVALEPDPESFRYLENTVDANASTGAPVECLTAAAAAARGTLRLYLSSDNRGDNRVYAPDKGWPSVEVAAETVDDLLEARGINQVHFVKIDVQGAEGAVLAGMARTLAQSPRVVVLTEFWPQGLRLAGSSPEAMLATLRAAGLNVHQLARGGTLKPLRDDEELIASLPGRCYTNLVARRSP